MAAQHNMQLFRLSALFYHGYFRFYSGKSIYFFTYAKSAHDNGPSRYALKRGLLIRQVGTEFLGIIFVRLELLSTSVLFFSREMIRRAISSGIIFNDKEIIKFSEKLHYLLSRDSSLQKSVNLTWLFLPIGIIISTFMASLWIYLDIDASEGHLNMQYPYACALIGFSSILQIFEEPVYFLGAKFLQAKNKSAAEASMLVSRSLLYVLAALYAPTNWQIIVFAAAHAFSSLICSTVHWFLWYLDLSNSEKLIDMKNEKKNVISLANLLPKRDEIDGEWFDQSQIERLKAFFDQGFSKQILTEGERFIGNG